MSNPILVSVSSGTDSDSDSYIITKFNRRVGESELVDICAEYIQAGRNVPFVASYYWDAEKIMTLRSAPTDMSPARWRAMFELISVFSSMNPVYCMALIAFANRVQVIGGQERDCVCVTTMARYGSENAIYPYSGEPGSIVFEDMTTADENGPGEYPTFVSYSLASYAFAYRGFGRVSEVLEWLSKSGVTVQFFGDWDLSTIDARMDHYPDLESFIEEPNGTETVSD